MLFSNSSLCKPSMGLNNRTFPFGISDAKVCDSLWSFNSSEYIVSIPWLLVRDNVYDLLWKKFHLQKISFGVQRVASSHTYYHNNGKIHDK